MSTRAQARELLHTASAGTDRELLAWAVGADQVHHCLYLARYRHTRKPADLGTECAGGAGGGFEYWINRKGFTGSARATGYEFTVSWRAVAAVLTRVVDEPELVATQDALLHQRVQLTGRKDEQFRRRQRGERSPAAEAARDTLNDEWAALERACTDAATDTWQACYPHRQQLALFG